jgi:hypothetical protein
VRDGRDSEKPADGTQIELEIFRLDPELRAYFGDRLLEPHEGETDRLSLIRCQRSRIHPPDGLALEQLPDELHEREDQTRDRTADVVWIRIPAGRRPARQARELRAHGLELLDLDVRYPPAGGWPSRCLSTGGLLRGALPSPF